MQRIWKRHTCAEVAATAPASSGAVLSRPLSFLLSFGWAPRRPQATSDYKQNALCANEGQTRFTASTGYGTRISVNSWTVSTFRRRRPFSRSKPVFTSVRLFLSVVLAAVFSFKTFACRMSLPLCFYHMTTTMHARETSVICADYPLSGTTKV